MYNATKYSITTHINGTCCMQSYGTKGVIVGIVPDRLWIEISIYIANNGQQFLLASYIPQMFLDYIFPSVVQYSNINDILKHIEEAMGNTNGTIIFPSEIRKNCKMVSFYFDSFADKAKARQFLLHIGDIAQRNFGI